MAQPQETSEEQIKRLKWVFMDCCKRVCEDFEVTESNRDLLSDIFYWAIGWQSHTPLSVKKGLWLKGNVGSGKSTILKAVRAFDSKIKGTKNGFYLGGFRITNTSVVCMAYSKEGMPALDQYLINETHAFDELGREPVSSNYFGTPLNVLQHIFQMRYDRKILTHVSTNIMDDGEIIKRYGEHIYDRCVEMFNFVTVETEYSRRT